MPACNIHIHNHHRHNPPHNHLLDPPIHLLSLSLHNNNNHNNQHPDPHHAPHPAQEETP